MKRTKSKPPTIRSKEWTVIRRRLSGWADFDTREIFVDSGLRGWAAVDTAIHEALHAALPWLPEDHIAEAATAAVDVLRALGFRLTPPPAE